MAIINPEDVEGAPGGYGAGDERIAALEAELTQAHADNAKLETLWENAVAARDKLSEELTRARAERDAASRDAIKAIDERDYFEGRITQINIALGRDDEWSNACDVGDKCIEAAEELIAERDAAREALGKVDKVLAGEVCRYGVAANAECDNRSWYGDGTGYERCKLTRMSCVFTHGKAVDYKILDEARAAIKAEGE